MILIFQITLDCRFISGLPEICAVYIIMSIIVMLTRLLCDEVMRYIFAVFGDGSRHHVLTGQTGLKQTKFWILLVDICRNQSLIQLYREGSNVLAAQQHVSLPKELLLGRK